MRKFIFIFFLFCLVSSVFAQDDNAKVILKDGKEYVGRLIEQTDDYVKMDVGAGIAITLYWDEIETLDAGDAESEQKLIKQMASMISDVKKYYDTGELLSEGSRKEGLFRGYHKNGQIAIEGTFKDFMPYEGTYRGWTEDGTLYIDRKYDEGKLLDDSGNPANGVIITKDIINQTTEESTYEGGILNGVTKTYGSNGNLTSQAYFKDGKLHGPMKIFDQDGNVQMETMWENGSVKNFQEQ